MNKWVKENYSEESNNPYKVCTAGRPASLVLHSDTEQVFP